MLADPNNGRWQFVVGRPLNDWMTALRENMEVRMMLDEYLRRAAKETGMDGLTLWKQRNGRWQGSMRVEGSTGWTVKADYEDPVDALRSAIVGWNYDLFPEIVGLGENGPKRLAAWREWLQALEENVKARQMVRTRPQAAPAEEEDDEL